MKNSAKAMRELKVLHFAETLQGGVASFLNEIFEYQVQSCGEVTIICPRNQVDLIKVEGVRVIPVDYNSRSLGSVARLFLDYSRIKKTVPHNVLHLHSTFAGLVGRVGRSGKAVACVYCAHGWSFSMSISKYKKKVYELIESVLAMRSDVVVNISNHEQSIAIEAGISETKCRMIYNGVKDKDWMPLPEATRPKKLLFVGRYDKQKGLDILIEAMKELEKRGYELDIVGGHVVDGGGSAELLDYIKDWGWQDSAFVAKAMASADVVVMPSRWEGFGLVAIEAMRAGRPVLASGVGGLSEIVVDGVTGILFEPNSPTAIVAAFDRLSRVDVRDMGIKARLRFEEQFTSLKMNERTCDMYVEARERKRSSGRTA
ncbi:glycosyltransferase [Pleomorphomonas sp. PLEO]|uniref:glycosyltransferase n=1 Tax=Pleomorphomonas sp. PLEO TaxID=3239306 RepID=UPI00351F475C